ncbi:TPA: hypothetical protein MIG81_21955 [Klebsiella pneumoniae]|nr:hypothetical protein [Klebsiella pneumoniae]HBX7927917.1 hypothetical protein [Klebsiella pneumoniae]
MLSSGYGPEYSKMGYVRFRGIRSGCPIIFFLGLSYLSLSYYLSVIFFILLHCGFIGLYQDVLTLNASAK